LVPDLQLDVWAADNVIEDDGGRVQLERFPAAETSDGATEQTIGLMCRYIRESSDDDQVQAAANWARESFGGNSPDPAMKAWAVFWFLKHYMRFVVDEAPMFRLNEPNQQDLLYSPAVLIRTQDPSGDCDDFTMMGAALLKCLGVPFVIVTIAAGPDDPQRWSHVFLMAMLPSGPLPIDASHGSGPGWMVPASHTYRWQCWDEHGKPVDVQRPRKNGLNGWVATGLGQDLADTYISDNPLSSIDTSVFNTTPTSSVDLTGSNPDLLLGASPTGSTASSMSSGFNLTSFLNSLTAAASGTTQAYLKAQTAQQVAASGATAATGLINTVVPMVLLGLGAWLLVSMMQSRQH
jgi:hypothetical protein